LMPPSGPDAAASTMLESQGNTTRSCSCTASDRTAGLSDTSVQVGDGSNQFVVFQIPPLLAPRYITFVLFGSDAATSIRPEKVKLPAAAGAGPMGVQFVALKTTEGEGPPLTRSVGRPTISKMESEKTIQLLGLGIKKLLREYVVGVGIGGFSFIPIFVRGFANPDRFV